jgi:hypothetical protein
MAALLFGSAAPSFALQELSDFQQLRAAPLADRGIRELHLGQALIDQERNQ